MSMSLFDEVPVPVPPARREFLAGLLATWALGEGRKPKPHDRAILERIASDAIQQSELLLRKGTP